jgi:hypothetical protein
MWAQTFNIVLFIFRVDNIRSFASASQQGSLLCAHVMIGILLSKK